MAKATIIKDLGNGQYTIKRNWAGREGVQARIDAFRSEADLLEKKWEGMPQTTQDELFEKNIVQLQFTALRKKAEYLENNMPEDKEVDAWCADYTEGLTGEVGTIDIAGEFTADVNIRPGHDESSDYNGERDGELYPAIALGPWTSLLNQMIYPGWQRFRPLHRYGVIIERTIDYDANTCAVAIQPTFSLMNYNVNKSATGGGDVPEAAAGVKSSRVKNYNVNYGDVLGTDEIIMLRDGFYEQDAARKYFIQNSASAHPGFIDFVERNPTHPISTVTQLASPRWMTDEEYINIERICRWFDYFYKYESDRSGYKISDYWDVMYDIGDPWYQVPEYVGEPQQEFTFGNVNLLLDESGLAMRASDETFEEIAAYYHIYGDRAPTNLKLWYAATRLRSIGPKQKRTGDCEDFVLTKMQAIIESGFWPVENMQVLLCYVVNAGYHAVLGIQTSNRGFLISDQREYGQLYEIEQLRDTHIWESFSVATAAGDESDAIAWAKTQLVIQDVPIEYMDCNSEAFIDGDNIIVEFTDQDWNQPKAIGFKENPAGCTGVYIFPGQKQFTTTPSGSWVEDRSRTLKLSYYSESWQWKSPFPVDYFDRERYAATGENGIGLTAGGYADGISVDHLDVYDSMTDIFSIGENCPIGIFDLTLNSLKNGKCIAHGGKNLWSDTGLSKTYRYTISSDTWNWPATGNQVYNHASFVIDSIVFVVGGNSGSPTAGTIYYGADNFGWGYPDPYISHSGEFVSEKTVTSYDDNEKTWSQKTTCPTSNYVEVKGWNIENKGLVGGGAYTYETDWLVWAGYDTIEVSPGVFERVQIHWVHLDTGLKRDGSTYLYDKLTSTWTAKMENLSSATGNQATSTAKNETVALSFSLQTPGLTNHWFDYKLSTDVWRDRGEFGLYSYEEEGFVWSFDRLDAAGAEL
jgi:predicted transglutaminase-like cysteine proteinase